MPGERGLKIMCEGGKRDGHTGVERKELIMKYGEGRYGNVCAVKEREKKRTDW